MASRLEQLTLDIHETLNDATVEHRFGRKHLEHHDQERRIVWVRAPSRLEEPRQAAARKVVGTTEYRVTTCVDRMDAVEAHIWAEDDESIDQLLDNLVAAICLTQRFMAWGGYTYASQEPKEGGETARTEKIILRVSFRLPVPEEIKPLKVIIGLDHECGTLLPDGSTQPEPEEEDP